MNGQLTVWLPPSGAGMQWRFPWEFAWRNSGGTASGLVAGDYPVEFRNVPGYLAIPLANDPLVTNGLTTVVTNPYYSTPLLGSGALGSLTVTSITREPVRRGLAVFWGDGLARQRFHRRKSAAGHLSGRV